MVRLYRAEFSTNCERVELAHDLNGCSTGCSIVSPRARGRASIRSIQA